MQPMVQLTNKADGEPLAVAVSQIVLFKALKDNSGQPAGTIMWLDAGECREVAEGYDVIVKVVGGVFPAPAVS